MSRADVMHESSHRAVVMKQQQPRTQPRDRKEKRLELRKRAGRTLAVAAATALTLATILQMPNEPFAVCSGVGRAFQEKGLFCGSASSEQDALGTAFGGDGGDGKAGCRR